MVRFFQQTELRRIQKAQIRFISLVPRGMNRMPTLYKGDGMAEFQTLVKASEDAGELTAIVYPADYVDAEGDIASAEVVKAMAHEFQRAGGQVDIRHDGKPVGRDKAYVAESFIVQKGDPRFQDWKDYDGKPVDAAGAWATVIKIDDPELRRLYREGAWNGVSMAGPAEVVAQKSDDAGWFFSALRKLFGRVGSREDDIDMEKQELLDALKGFQTELVKELKPQAPPSPEVDLTDPKSVEAHLARLKKGAQPEVDVNDPKALEAHLKTLRNAELAKSVDFSDVASVEAHLASLKAAADGDAPGDEGDDVSDEIKALKKQLAKLEGRSNQPGGESAQLGEYAGLSKEMVAAARSGDRMAAYLNGEEEKS